MDPITATGVNGQVTFDGKFVTIARNGALARMTVGKGEKRIPVSSITAVQWKPPSRLVRGFIQFSVPGGNEGKSRAGRQTRDAAGDENSVLVDSRHAAEFETLRSAVEGAIGAPAAATSSGGVADELKKLSELRDGGILPEEEFAAQKARLLS